MSFPGSPNILRGGIVPLDPVTSAVLAQRLVVLQYNPDSLSRTLQVQAVSADDGDPPEVLRLKKLPVEIQMLEAKTYATGQLRPRCRTVLDTESDHDFEKADRT